MDEETQVVDVQQPETPSDAAPIDEQPAVAEGEEIDRKPSRLEKRFARLTSEIHQLRGQNEMLMRSINGGQQAQPQSAAPIGRPNRDSFEDEGQYLEALTDWKVEQKLAQTSQAQTRQQAEHKYALAQQQAAIQYEDWEEVMAFARSIPVSDAVSEAILYSDHATDLQYYLAKNPQEALALNGMPPIVAARMVGAIEAKIAAEKAQRAAPAPAPKKVVSAAPAPIAPIGGRGEVEVDISKMSDAEFAKYRRQQIASRGKN